MHSGLGVKTVVMYGSVLLNSVSGNRLELSTLKLGAVCVAVVIAMAVLLREASVYSSTIL